MGIDSKRFFKVCTLFLYAQLMKTLKRIVLNKNIRHGILYTLFSFINNGVSFFLLLILAKYLKPDEYGYLNLFTSIINMLSIIIALSTNAYISVSFFQKTKTYLQQIITTCLITASLVSLLLLFITYFNKEYLTETIGLNYIYIIISILICYFQLYNNINLDLWRLNERPIAYGIFSFAYSIANFSLSIILVTYYKFGWVGRIDAWLIIAFIFFAIDLFLFYKNGYIVWKFPNKTIIIETLRYSLPLIPHLMSNWFKQGFDRFIINYFYNATEVGYYSFAMNIAAIITMIGTAFNSTNSVTIFKKLSKSTQDNIKLLRKQTIFMSIIFISLTIIVIISAILLIHLFFRSYENSIIYIIPLCIGGLFQCLYLIKVNYIFYYKKTHILMGISVVSALVQLCISLILIKVSIVYAALISMIISLLTMLSVYYYTTIIIRNTDQNLMNH